MGMKSLLILGALGALPAFAEGDKVAVETPELLADPNFQASAGSSPWYATPGNIEEIVCHPCGNCFDYGGAYLAADNDEGSMAISQDITVPVADSYRLTISYAICAEAGTGELTASMGGAQISSAIPKDGDVYGETTIEIRPAPLGEAGASIPTTLTIEGKSVSGDGVLIRYAQLYAHNDGTCLTNPEVTGTWYRNACNGWSRDIWTFNDDNTVVGTTIYDAGTLLTITRTGTYCLDYTSFWREGDISLHFDQLCREYGPGSDHACEGETVPCMECSEVDESYEAKYSVGFDIPGIGLHPVCPGDDGGIAPNGWLSPSSNVESDGHCDLLAPADCTSPNGTEFQEDPALTGTWHYQLCGYEIPAYQFDFAADGSFEMTVSDEPGYTYTGKYQVTEGYLRNRIIAEATSNECFVDYCPHDLVCDGNTDVRWCKYVTLDGTYAVHDGLLSLYAGSPLGNMRLTRDPVCNGVLSNLILSFAEADSNGDGRLSVVEAGDYGLSSQIFNDLSPGSMSSAQVVQAAGSASPVPSADLNLDLQISLSELLRLVQIFSVGAYRCNYLSEDGYKPDAVALAENVCAPHAADYAPADRKIDLNELLRVIQLYAAGGYERCEGGEDGFCAFAGE